MDVTASYVSTIFPGGQVQSRIKSNNTILADDLGETFYKFWFSATLTGSAHTENMDVLRKYKIKMVCVYYCRTGMRLVISVIRSIFLSLSASAAPIYTPATYSQPRNSFFSLRTNGWIAYTFPLSR
ncbi:hypothetical protein AB1N83_003886 [Pleurotus pulmonarius]